MALSTGHGEYETRDLSTKFQQASPQRTKSERTSIIIPIHLNHHGIILRPSTPSTRC